MSLGRSSVSLIPKLPTIDPHNCKSYVYYARQTPEIYQVLPYSADLKALG